MNRYIKIILIGITILHGINLNAGQHAKDNSGILIRYHYLPGEVYRYKKLTTSKYDQYTTYLRILAKDSIGTGSFPLEYTIDSILLQDYAHNPALAPKISRLKDVKLTIAYDKYGRKPLQYHVDVLSSGYLSMFDNSDVETLFALPTKSIAFGKSWNSEKTDYNGHRSMQIQKFTNVLTSTEMKQGHDCFRIDFNGNVSKETYDGDLTLTDKGTVSGCYWIDRQKGILIAVESETIFTGITAKHPGLSPWMRPPLIKSDSFRSSLVLIGE
ncbi:hypothetical protein [Parabacteroides sp. FAFU027]|uniref:hypothetical protein n=1 Tax=Parabacteroides sp. FAFU027 TaxID=2922715 RepID=UPI001FB0336B|nr:hypothetical protein [Parabacteroides sp. FAFU027]